MAQTQVSYTDKVENSGATNDGKVQAVDMNCGKNWLKRRAEWTVG